MSVAMKFYGEFVWCVDPSKCIPFSWYMHAYACLLTSRISCLQWWVKCSLIGSTF